MPILLWIIFPYVIWSACLAPFDPSGTSPE